jgi:uncharacterized protein YqeY
MLKQQIQADATNALKIGDKFASGVFRMILASVISKEKDKRYKISKKKSGIKEEDLVKESELTDEELVEIILAEVKKRRDAIGLFEQGGRQELADNEKKEIQIIKKYLPEQISLDKLRKLVEESIKKVKAEEMKDMGKVMADLNPKVKGKADSSEISRIVKEILSQN